MTTTSTSAQTATVLEKLLSIAAEVAADPNRFVMYADKPVEFSQEVLGIKLWKKQKRIIRAIARGSRRVAIRSGHGVGKTLLMAVIVLWWLYARRGIVVSTAPTKEHVEDVLWREINERVAKALVPLPGTASQTELRISNAWYATGISTNKASAFQGRHHEWLLAVIDEAPGVAEQVHLEISTLATGAKNCVVMIGNPTDTSGTFYEAFSPHSPWETFHISCLEHPNVVSGYEQIPGAVTREWVEERRKAWGEQHPFWYSRVIGEFPKISTRGVIPLAWIEKQQDETARKAVLEREAKLGTPRIGGLDVARYGDNKTVYFQRRGDAVEKYEAWSHLSLMETANKAAELISENNLEYLVVDASGIGAGVVDRLLEMGLPVVSYNGGHRAFTPSTFSNRRGELWWRLRERFERGKLWIPDDCPQLVRDLVTPEYELNVSGRIKVENKETLLERGVKSPDYADALVLCFALDDEPLEEPTPKPSKGQDPQAFADNGASDDTEPGWGLPAGF